MSHVLKYRRFSLAQGVTLSITGLLVGTAAWVAAPLISTLVIRIVALLIAWFCFWFFSHDLAHHLVGRMVGIQFEYYFVGRSALRKLSLPAITVIMQKVPVLGLKIDSSSLERVSPNGRRWMLRSGAIASMGLPWIVLPASYSIGPLWVGVLFTILTLGNDLFTLYFSPKVGDFGAARAVRG